MRTRLILLFACVTVSVMGAAVDPILLELDRAVESRDEYILRKQQQISNLQRVLPYISGRQKYDVASEIYDLYDSFNTDSALYYAQLCEQIAVENGESAYEQYAQICIAKCLAINGMYVSAERLLQSMEANLFTENANLYYKTLCSMYIWKSGFMTLQEEKQIAWDHVPDLRVHVIENEDNPIWREQEQALLWGGDDPWYGINHLRPIVDTMSVDNDFMRFLANSLGSFYMKASYPDSALHYFAISAISDIRHGILEHASLREVALLLYQSGTSASIARAYKYMNVCIEDAQVCKARLRTIEMANDMPLILDAYQARIERTNRLKSIFLIVLSVLSVILLVFVIYAFCLARKVMIARRAAEQAAEQLRHSNRQLSEESRIRATYVTQYMKECSQVIQRLDDYHQHLLRIATHGTSKDMFNAVKTSEYIDETLSSFYCHFDDTFLGLFPDFIEEINALLRPEVRFEMPQHKRLSTELRILALIRLGITDSEQIAHFLRCSIKTVHNYRAAIRNRAIGEREQLEQQIASV